MIPVSETPAAESIDAKQAAAAPAPDVTRNKPDGVPVITDDELCRKAAELELEVMPNAAGRPQILIAKITSKKAEVRIAIARSARGGAIVTASSWFPRINQGGRWLPDGRGCLSLIAEDIEGVCVALRTARAVLNQLGWSRSAARRTGLAVIGDGKTTSIPRQQYKATADAGAEIQSTQEGG